MNITAIIPARAGSKGVRDKNIKSVFGKPLIAYTIEQSLQSDLINRTIVSTDSEYYAEIAQSFGAETPFLRPKELAGDLSTDLEVFKHSLKWLDKHEGAVPDIVVHLRPTSPLRSKEMIDKAIHLLLEDEELDAVRTISHAKKSPYKMWVKNEDGYIKPILKLDRKDFYNLPRQLLPEVYEHDGCIDVIRARTILEKDSMTGDKIYGLVNDFAVDIDSEQDFAAIKPALVKGSSQNAAFNLLIDIDGVIANLSPNNDYSKSSPRKEAIDVINTLFERGHNILIFTARGSESGIDFQALTKKALSDWGVKYNELIFGKPNADFYVDDKAVTLEDLKTLI
jgi:CMP-N-acetylneuraminic acid synthetase